MPGSGVEWRNGMVRPRHVMRLAIEHARCLRPPIHTPLTLQQNKSTNYQLKRCNV
jgi:hypothetical protein